MQPRQLAPDDAAKRFRTHRYDAYVPPVRGEPRAPAATDPVQAIPVSEYAAKARSMFDPPAANEPIAYKLQQQTPAVYDYRQDYNPGSQQSVSGAQASYRQHAQQQTRQQTRRPPTERETVAKSGVFSKLVDASVKVDRVARERVRIMRHTFEPPHIAALRTRKQKLVLRGFYSLAAASMVASLALGVYVLLHPNKTQKLPITSVLGAQTDAHNDANRLSEVPSERVPTVQDMKTFLVAPQYPRYLRISSIGLESRVRRLGLDSSGSIGTPNNIFDVGWYDSSVLPGDKDGASVIVGHVSGPSAHGVFWDLNKLNEGNVIDIEKGNGEVLHYKVTKSAKVLADDFSISVYLKGELPGHNDLKLITSTGKFDNVNVKSSDRLIVFAQQQL